MEGCKEEGYGIREYKDEKDWITTGLRNSGIIQGAGKDTGTLSLDTGGVFSGFKVPVSPS